MAIFTLDLLTGNPLLLTADFTGSGSTSVSGSTYTEVNLYADLPSAAVNSNKIFVVRTSSGTYMTSRKEAGLYRSNGVSWSRLGDIPSFFNSNNFQIFDGDDNTSGVKFITSNILSGVVRNLTVQNASGTIAYLSDVALKLNTSLFNTYTGDTDTLIGTKLNITSFNSFTGTTLPSVYYNKTQINSYTGKTNTLIGTKVNSSTFNTFTGTTAPNTYYNKSQINSYTGITGLAQVTAINAATALESTFSGGLITNKIKPVTDSTTAIQIHKANGTSHVVNIDTVSGFTGIGTATPKGLLHVYGSDISGGAIGLNVQSNSIIIDGVAGADKNIVWSENGTPKWLAKTYREENGKFWYLSNVEEETFPIVISESGRIGINGRPKLMNYHAAQTTGTGLNDIEIGGSYDRTYNTVYLVQIDSNTGATDTFIWKKSVDNGDNYGAWSSSSACTLTYVNLAYGVTLKFSNITGHTTGNAWTFAGYSQLPNGTFVITPNKFNEVLRTDDYTAGTIIYDDITAEANSSTVGVTIEIFKSGSTTSAIYFGAPTQIDAIFVNLKTPGNGIVLIAEYWNGVSWISVEPIDNVFQDSTFNLTKSGSLSWDLLSLTQWVKSYLPDVLEDSYNLYWVRFRTSTSPNIAPTAKSFARGGDKRFSVLTSPFDFKPSFFIDSLGRVNIGGGNITGKNALQITNKTTIYPIAGYTESLVEIDSEDSDAIDLKLRLSSNDRIGAGINIIKTRGTLDTPLNTISGDTIGHITFSDHIGTTAQTLAKIESIKIVSGSTRLGNIVISVAEGLNTVEKLRISNKGIGIGVTPSAILHLGSGSTANASLKFTSSPVLATPQAGAMEFLNDKWYGTITSGNARKTFAFLESPTFTGTVSLPSGTTLNNPLINGINLNTYIINSGGTSNPLLTKTSLFNSYTGASSPILNGAVTGVSNGLTVSNRLIGLGGTLSNNTIVSGDSYDLTLRAKKINILSHDGIDMHDKHGNNINIFSSGGTVTLKGRTTLGVESLSFALGDTQATFTDSRILPRGIEYANDYSSTFNSNSLVNKAYVDGIAAGISAHEAVMVATTAPINLITPPATIGGVTMLNGYRVLVKNQVTGSTNGVYDWHLSGMTRSSDFDGAPGLEVVNGAYVSVITGATNENTSWILTSPNPIVIGVTSLNFVLFSSQAGVAAGAGVCVTQSGGNYNVSVKLAANPGICSDNSGIYLNPAIAGTGICYGTGIISLDGINIAGNSLSWSGSQLNVNTTGGTLSTALNSKLNTSVYSAYTGATQSTINNKLNTIIFSTYTGTTVPNNYYNKTQINVYTGTTVPNNYYNKTQINTYTGATSTAIGLKAPITSPTFLVSARSVTPTVNDNSTCIITSAWYIGQGATANALMDGTAGCGTSNLFARQDHIHPSDTTRLTTTAFSTYSGTTAPNVFAPKASPTFTGAVTMPTPFTLGAVSVKTTGTELNFVTGATSNIQTQINLKAPIASPTFTGSPSATTASVNTNTTRIATTAFVLGQASRVNPLMNGVAASGTSFSYSRQDHVHPSDTTKANLTSPVFQTSVKINGSFNIVQDNSVAGNDTYTATDATLTPVAGMLILFRSLTSNTGACTLNMNGIGAKAIQNFDGSNPGNDDIVANKYTLMVYDGTVWTLMR